MSPQWNRWNIMHFNGWTTAEWFWLSKRVLPVVSGQLMLVWGWWQWVGSPSCAVIFRNYRDQRIHWPDSHRECEQCLHLFLLFLFSSGRRIRSSFQWQWFMTLCYLCVSMIHGIRPAAGAAAASNRSTLVCLVFRMGWWWWAIIDSKLDSMPWEYWLPEHLQANDREGSEWKAH